MSASDAERALARMLTRGATLLPVGTRGEYAACVGGDRRRRPLARLSARDVAALHADGAIMPDSTGGFVLSEAGAARARRAEAAPGEAFAAQHGAIVERAVIDADGDLRGVRGRDPSPVLSRLSRLRDAAGAPWLSDAELRAASRLCADWQRSQAGVVRGSDWTSPPMSAGARGPGNAQEGAMAARCDAGRRVADALAKLATPLRRVVERVCLSEQGLEALERAEGWPARSGRLALKLALAQLAATL